MTYEDIKTQFDGGIALSTKTSLPNAARFTRNLAIYEDSDSVTLTPKPIKDSSTTVTDLVKWIVDANPYENARYAYGDTGNVYRIASDVWSLDHFITTGNPTGQGMVMLSDALYMASGNEIARKYVLSSGVGTYNDNFFSDGVNNLDLSVTASGQTYTPPVAIAETAANKYSWVPAKDPYENIQIFVTTKGTGNWTVTVHDDLNFSLGTATVANASLTNGAMNNFTLSTAPNQQVRFQLGKTYHVHVTSTVADGTMQTSASNDLSTAQIKGFIGTLVNDTDYHPMILHTNGVTGIWVCGNSNYLATYDGTTFNPNKITLEPGYKVRALTKINEYVAAWCWKGNSIDGYEYGQVFFWDGILPYYNFKRELTQGMPNACVNFKNRIFGIFGSNGDLALAPDESASFRQLQPAPKLTIGKMTEVLPGAIGVWQRRALFGYSNTNDTLGGAYNDTSAGVHVAGDTYTPPSGLEQGVYEFGNQSDRAISYTSVSSEVLNFAFLPSTTIASPLSFKIGCIMPFGKDCYVSYKDGSTYYVDRITKGNNPASIGSWESLIADETLTKFKQMLSQPQKMKRGLRVVVTSDVLPTGCTLTAKYRANRSAPWIFGKSSIAGTTYAFVLMGGLGGLNYREVEYGFDVTASSTGYPLITSVSLILETSDQETSEGQL